MAGETTIGSLMVLLGLKDQMSPALRAANQQVELFSGGLGGLAKKAAGIFTVGAAITAVNKALMAQAESEAAINRLNLALANQGMYSEKTSKALLDYAATLQDVSTFDDEAVVAAEALLVSFGMNEDQIRRTISAAADFAAITGGSLQSAVEAITRGVEGQGRAFKQYGIEVEDSGTRTKNLDNILGQLEDKFGGSAQAATQNYAGSMKQLGNAMGDAWETAGKFFGFLTSSGDKPFAALINAAKGLQKFFGQDLIIAFSEAKAQIAEALAWITGAAEKTFDFLGKMPGSLGAGFRKAAEDAGLLRSALENQAEKFREQGDAAAASAGKLQTVTNATGVTRTKMDELTEGGKKNIEMLKAWERALEDAENAARESSMNSEQALINSWFNEEAAYYQHTAMMMSAEQQLIDAWKKGDEEIINGYMNKANAAIQAGMTEIQTAQATLIELTNNYNALLAKGIATDQQLTTAYAAMKAAERALDEASLKAKIAGFETIAQSTATILRSLFGKSKAAAIAAAIIDTIAAIVKTMAAYPWPFNLIPAAAAAAAGYAEVQKIRNTNVEGFRQGSGFRDFGTETPTYLHGIERVQTPAQAAAELSKAGSGNEEMVSELRGLRRDLKDLPQIMRYSLRDAMAFNS